MKKILVPIIVAANALLPLFSPAPQAQEISQAEIRAHNGRPMVSINGKPTALPGYSSVAAAPRFDPIRTKQTARFFPHRMGAYYVTIPAIKVPNWWEAYWDTPFWVGDKISSTPLGESEGSLDEQVEHILKGDPGAHIIVRFFAHEPKSWRELHPDQLFINEEGQRVEAPSFASTLYREKAAEFCEAIIAYCESRPWANRIIGYANFSRQEGTHEPIIYGWMFDHSPLMTARWREFLREKYKTVEALRTAHNDPEATFESVEVPRDKLRGAVPQVSQILYWQNAKDNQPLRDYLLLTRDLYHQLFRAMAGAMDDAVRTAGHKRFLVYDTFKLPMMGWDNTGFFDEKLSWSPAFPENLAASGHMNITDLFNARGFDGLITPHDYQARGVGGVYEPEGMVDSAILRGKMFFSEMDTRTHTGTDPIFASRNDREFAAITWRNLAASWTRGFNSYWMDLHQDWFASAPIHKVINRQVQTVKDSVNWKHETMPGIAMILDDTAVLETNGSGNVFNEQIMWEQKMGLARCGVPFRIYQFEDLTLSNFPKHRVFYFPNLYRVDSQRMRVLQNKVFRDGNIVVWGPGSGISDGEKIGPESAKRLTGFDFDMIPSNYQHRALISDFTHPIMRGLPADTVLGGPLAYGPLLFPKDGQRLAEAWTKLGRVHSGLSVKIFGRGAPEKASSISARGAGDWVSVFTTAAPLPASLWRNLARYGGAHVYSESNDVLMADSSIVALHSVQSGRKIITLPGRFTVHDVVSGKLVGRGLKAVQFTLSAPETRVFRLEP